ncbi:MAG: purine-nucleoside phosphorylase [Pseudomonadota bacterium]
MTKLKPRCHELIGGLAEKPSIAIQLGTGLSDSFSQHLDIVTSLPYSDLYELANPSAVTHQGILLLGKIHDIPIVVFSGRYHLYENLSAYDVCLNTVLAKYLGCNIFIYTNAAGALNDSFHPGDVVAISDHINASGENPLIGFPEQIKKDFYLEHPFVDMSDAYNAQGRELILQSAQAIGVKIASGIYAGVKGPSLESSAERRALRTLGADLVGMSTVNEVICCNYLGMRAIGLSAITNMASGGPDQQPDTIDDILVNAARAGEVLEEIILPALPELNGLDVLGAN